VDVVTNKIISPLADLRREKVLYCREKYPDAQEQRKKKQLISTMERYREKKIKAKDDSQQEGRRIRKNAHRRVKRKQWQSWGTL